jgi:hypothetical protein
MTVSRADVVRFLFGGYAGTIVVLTHWPRLRIEAPFERPDLLVHIVVFFLWTSFAIASGIFGSALTRSNVLRTALLAAICAAVDEVTQGIPGLGRTVAMDDLLANAIGIAASTLLFLSLSRRQVS